MIINSHSRSVSEVREKTVDDDDSSGNSNGNGAVDKEACTTSEVEMSTKGTEEESTSVNPVFT